MKKFNFFHRPHNIAFVDDDESFLQVMEMALPKSWHSSFFTKTQAMSDFLKHQSMMAQRDYVLFKKIFDDSQSNEHPIARVLQYWKQNPQRWGLTEIAVFDYAMPRATGIELLSSLDNWKGLSILLTGVADEHIAVKAFNAGLIQRYIPKQSENLIESLINDVSQLSPNIFKQYQQVCENSLNSEQLLYLKKEATQAFLSQFAREKWIEYLVIGNPFGILGVDQFGTVSWLQLERACDLDDLNSIAILDQWDAASLELIQSGEAIPNSLLRQALKGSIKHELAQSIKIDGSGLIAGFFQINPPIELANPTSYNLWRSEIAKQTALT